MDSQARPRDLPCAKPVSLRAGWHATPRHDGSRNSAPGTEPRSRRRQQHPPRPTNKPKRYMHGDGARRKELHAESPPEYLLTMRYQIVFCSQTRYQVWLFFFVVVVEN